MTLAVSPLSGLPPLQRDGRGARIALIDSGVDASHPWLSQAALEHVRVERQGKGFDVVPADSGDHSGHGTACAGIIHRLVPAASITSVRALGQDGRCSRGALIHALIFCIKQRFDVVNLSLGIDIPRKAALKVSDHLPLLRLYEAADAANTLGVVLVASGPNVHHFRTYPGRFKSLVGVGRDNFEDREMLRSERTRDYEVVAPGTDVLAPALGGGERRWTGTSFACPFVTAHVARIRAARPGLAVAAVKVALHSLAAACSPTPASESS